MMAAGLLTSLAGALSVTVLGMGTTAVMLKAAWLRDWLYHGQHLLYGVQNLSSGLKTLPVIAYSHEITGSVDAQVFHGIIIIFPLIALILTALVAAARGDAAAGRGDPRRGGGGPPGPEPAPGQPDGGQPTVTNDGAGLAASLPGLDEPGPGIQQDRLTAALADAAVQPAGMRLSPARRARNLLRETRGAGASRPGDGQRQAVNRGEGTLGGAYVTCRAAPSWRVTTLPRQS
jgi:hypothetical protein